MRQTIRVKKLLILLCVAASAEAQVLVNPAFDEPHLDAGYLTVPAGSSAIGGWEVTSGDVDVLAAGFYAGQSSQALDLNGTQAGAVRAAVSLSPGTRYEVTFHYRLNPSAERAQTLLASWDGAPYVLVNAEPENDPNRAATLQAASFVIQTDGTDSLSFQSLNDGVAGVLLEFATVSQAAFDAPLSQPLTPVPEPGGTVFASAILLAGYAAYRSKLRVHAFARIRG
jgi:hypothetical protein